MEEKNDLDLLRDTFRTLGIRYHEVVKGDSTYIQKMSVHDMDGHIFVSGFGLVKLDDPRQLESAYEFEGGKLVSW